MNRKQFIQSAAVGGLGLFFAEYSIGNVNALVKPKLSEFARRLSPLHRILEQEGYYVWCCSPVFDENDKVHVFYSRWDAKKGMGGWINGSEICQAVADHPEAEFKHVRVILKPRGREFWDGTTCHNPLIKKVDGKYALFYMGNCNGKTNTKRIGLSICETLDGKFQHADQPLLLPGSTGTWDDHCTTNPAFVQHPDGKYYLFYKSWNTEEYEHPQFEIRGNRKYGLAVADKLEGPYVKSSKNPVIDFSGKGNNAQIEDAYVWWQNNRFNMLARDMGFYDHQSGIHLYSKKGIRWSKPQIAYQQAAHYINQPPAPKHLKKYGRFERPQLLLNKQGIPAYLFVTTQGGKYQTSSPFIFKLKIAE